MSHALIIGGTGMLKAVTLLLLEKYDTVSVTARSGNKFSELENGAGKNKKRINRLIIDYTDYASLTGGIIKSIEEFGEISQAVCWIHSTAPLAPLFTAKVINDKFDESVHRAIPFCDYYEILGSASANPENHNIKREGEFMKFDFIKYHKIILEFIHENGKSRWLTDIEITNGIIYAINNKLRKYVVGTVEPWKKRP